MVFHDFNAKTWFHDFAIWIPLLWGPGSFEKSSFRLIWVVGSSGVHRWNHPKRVSSFSVHEPALCKFILKVDFSMPWGPLVHCFCICSVLAANVLQNQWISWKIHHEPVRLGPNPPRCVGGYIGATSIFLEIWWNMYKTCGWPHLRCVKDRHWIACGGVFFKEINAFLNKKAAQRRSKKHWIFIVFLRNTQ